MSFQRRGGPIFFGICCLAILLLYGYFKVNNLQGALERKNRDISERKQNEKTLHEELEVLYKHTRKLEDVLKNDRESHEQANLDYVKQLKQCNFNLTKTKHEAMNRFNALDTSYKMLHANNEEVNQNYVALQENCARLGTDQKRLREEYQKDYQTLKDAKEGESESLQSRIQDLFNQKLHHQKRAEKCENSYNELLESSKKSNEIGKEYQQQIKVYSAQAHKAKIDLQNCLSGKPKPIDESDNSPSVRKVHNSLEKQADIQPTDVTAQTENSPGISDKDKVAGAKSSENVAKRVYEGEKNSQGKFPLKSSDETAERRGDAENLLKKDEHETETRKSANIDPETRRNNRYKNVDPSMGERPVKSEKLSHVLDTFRKHARETNEENKEMFGHYGKKRKERENDIDDKSLQKDDGLIDRADRIANRNNENVEESKYGNIQPRKIEREGTLKNLEHVKFEPQEERLNLDIQPGAFTVYPKRKLNKRNTELPLNNVAEGKSRLTFDEVDGKRSDNDRLSPMEQKSVVDKKPSNKHVVGDADEHEEGRDGDEGDQDVKKVTLEDDEHGDQNLDQENRVQVGGEEVDGIDANNNNNDDNGEK